MWVENGRGVAPHQSVDSIQSVNQWQLGRVNSNEYQTQSNNANVWGGASQLNATERSAQDPIPEAGTTSVITSAENPLEDSEPLRDELQELLRQATQEAARQADEIDEVSTHSLEHPISINNIKYCYGVIISSGATSVVISAGNPPPDSQALRWLWRQGTHEAARQAHEMDQVIKGASPTTPVTARSPLWAGGTRGSFCGNPDIVISERQIFAPRQDIL